MGPIRFRVMGISGTLLKHNPSITNLGAGCIIRNRGKFATVLGRKNNEPFCTSGIDKKLFLV